MNVSSFSNFVRFKFLQNLKLTIFEKFYSIDPQIVLNPSIPAIYTRDWQNDFLSNNNGLDLRTFLINGNYLSLFDLEQSNLFLIKLLFFLNSNNLSIYSDYQIFSILKPNEIQVPTNVFEILYATPKKLFSLLTLADSFFKIDPFLLLVQNSTFHPLTKFFYTFKVQKSNNTNLHMRIGEFLLINFLDSYKNQVASFQNFLNLYSPLILPSLSQNKTNQIDYLNNDLSQYQTNAFLAYFYYFLFFYQPTQNTSNYAATSYKTFVKNLLGNLSLSSFILLETLQTFAISQTQLIEFLWNFDFQKLDNYSIFQSTHVPFITTNILILSNLTAPTQSVTNLTIVNNQLTSVVYDGSPATTIVQQTDFFFFLFKLPSQYVLIVLTQKQNLRLLQMQYQQKTLAIQVQIDLTNTNSKKRILQLPYQGSSFLVQIIDSSSNTVSTSFSISNSLIFYDFTAPLSQNFAIISNPQTQYFEFNKTLDLLQYNVSTDTFWNNGLYLTQTGNRNLNNWLFFTTNISLQNIYLLNSDQKYYTTPINLQANTININSRNFSQYSYQTSFQGPNSSFSLPQISSSVNTLLQSSQFTLYPTSQNSNFYFDLIEVSNQIQLSTYLQSQSTLFTLTDLKGSTSPLTFLTFLEFPYNYTWSFLNNFFSSFVISYNILYNPEFITINNNIISFPEIVCYFEVLFELVDLKLNVQDLIIYSDNQVLVCSSEVASNSSIRMVFYYHDPNFQSSNITLSFFQKTNFLGQLMFYFSNKIQILVNPNNLQIKYA